MFDDAEEGMDAMTREAASASSVENQEATGEAPTALLSKSVFSGKTYKPGDKIQVRMIKDLGDQVEVVCEHGDEESPAEDTAEGSEEPPGVGDPQANSYLE
jgi:hypothetical protein